MRVLIDALTAREGGGTSYIRHLLPALLAHGAPHQYAILLSSAYQAHLVETLPPGVGWIDAEISADGLVRRLLFEQIDIPRLLRRGRFDVLFTVNDVATFRAPCPHVVLARNLSIYGPLAAVTGWRQRWERLIYRVTRQPVAFLALRAADRVVFVSEAVRGLVTGQLRLDPRKTRVVHHGVSACFVRRRGGLARGSQAPQTDGERLPDGYLLAVSSIAPHKNYETLLDAYATLLEERGDAPDLVIAGAIADGDLFDRLRRRASAFGSGGRVRFLGRVAYDQLPQLYWGAQVFIFPSRLETFGLPLVEAMAAGAPVVASALPVCEEVCADAALYFEPHSAADLAAKIGLLLGAEDLRRTLSARAEARARQFSWEATARAIVGILEEVAGAAPQGA